MQKSDKALDLRELARGNAEQAELEKRLVAAGAESREETTWTEEFAASDKPGGKGPPRA
ncbi:MAG: hypothetical protein QNJ87_14225 [Gammaproteobacteria bacterium]|nr:hypothetical protein [Gammaproteobacteria bacterium]MDJ0872906.1 hypothetical protein [Gammaproteobacteria bacterium]MDJ0891345.1 hypothetical protein [Gammaproteobacteria bacterium]